MPPKNIYSKIRDESDLSLEVVILLVLGLFGVLFGLLLFQIHTGALPYTPDSMYGLFLVIVSFQIITLGKTPFGDLRRSWWLIIVGISAAVIGMASCFVPGYLTYIVRLLVGVILFAGGISLLVQLFLSKEKARLWLQNPGILQHLTIACGLVYILMIILGLITLLPGITTNPQTAIFLIIFGISIFYLAYYIQKVVRIYPTQDNQKDDDSKEVSIFLKGVSFPVSVALLILLGVLITLLGVLLFPVVKGIIPISADGELGLLLVVLSIQMMAMGNTPIGQFKRSWIMILIGIVFAGFGIFSCIVPGILTAEIYILIGLLNIIGGSILIIKQFLPIIHEIRNPPEEEVVIPTIFKRMLVAQILLYAFSILFGLSMLLVGLIPGLVIAGILVINGLIFFVVAYLFEKITQMDVDGIKGD